MPSTSRTGGNLFKLDADSGTRIWVRRIAEYNGIADSISRVTPAVDGQTLLIGDQNGAHLMAIRADTGDLIWITQLDPHVRAVITQSAVVAGNRVYVGVSSLEEIWALDPLYPCCTFRGSIVSLDAGTGAILWKTYMVPENHGRPGGYSGNAVWGSTPVVDVARNALYVTTGNNYTVPQAVEECERARQGAADPVREPTCLEPGNHVDAVVALDLTTGRVKWSRSLHGHDAWNYACFVGGVRNPHCPNPQGSDYDFGQGPMLFAARLEGTRRVLLAAGRKSGIFWGAGRRHWRRRVEHGRRPRRPSRRHAMGVSDRRRARLCRARELSANFVPARAVRDNCERRGVDALDAATGTMLWQTPDPMSVEPGLSGGLAMDTGPVTVANGVVYAGSLERQGHMYALEARTGRIQWTFKSGGSVNAGPAVVNGVVYWGSGYGRIGSPNDKLYAFTLGPRPR